MARTGGGIGGGAVCLGAGALDAAALDGRSGGSKALCEGALGAGGRAEREDGVLLLAGGGCSFTAGPRGA